MTPRVVVGVDGSSTAEAALAWSLEVAACYGADVEVLHAWRWTHPEPASDGPGPVRRSSPRPRAGPPTAARASTGTSAGRGTRVHAFARTGEGEVRAGAGVRGGRRGAAGGRTARPVRPVAAAGRAVAGSVAAHCLSRSPAPVVVVPHGAQATAPSRVVVGVDGSDASARALRWAHGHARAVGSRLVAVLAWQLTTLPAPSSMTAGVVPPLPEWHAKAEHLLDAVCRAALGVDARGRRRRSSCTDRPPPACST